MYGARHALNVCDSTNSNAGIGPVSHPIHVSAWIQRGQVTRHVADNAAARTCNGSATSSSTDKNRPICCTCVYMGLRDEERVMSSSGAYKNFFSGGGAQTPHTRTKIYIL